MEMPKEDIDTAVVQAFLRQVEVMAGAEGRELLLLFMAIRDQQLRDDVVRFAEAIASEKGWLAKDDRK